MLLDDATDSKIGTTNIFSALCFLSYFKISLTFSFLRNFAYTTQLLNSYFQKFDEHMTSWYCTFYFAVNLAYGYWFKGNFYAALNSLVCASYALISVWYQVQNFYSIEFYKSSRFLMAYESNSNAATPWNFGIKGCFTQIVILIV